MFTVEMVVKNLPTYNNFGVSSLSDFSLDGSLVVESYRIYVICPKGWMTNFIYAFVNKQM
jgi:hypothetical protein